MPPLEKASMEDDSSKKRIIKSDSMNFDIDEVKRKNRGILEDLRCLRTRIGRNLMVLNLLLVVRL